MPRVRTRHQDTLSFIVTLLWGGAAFGAYRLSCFIANSIVDGLVIAWYDKVPSPATVPPDGAWHGGEYAAVTFLTIFFSSMLLILIVVVVMEIAERLYLDIGHTKTVYHGTRVPMATIIEHGIPGLSRSDRLKLFEAIGAHITELGLPIKVEGAGTDVKGVFVTPDPNRAYPYALMAPAYVSDAMYDRLSQLGVTGQHADYIVLAILDRIGSPKLLECRVSSGRLRTVPGNFGLVLDNIRSSDIKSIQLIEYKDTKTEVIRIPQQISHIVKPVIQHWWNGVSLPEPTIPETLRLTTTETPIVPDRLTSGFLEVAEVTETTLLKPKPKPKPKPRPKPKPKPKPKAHTRSLGYKAAVRVSLVYHNNLKKKPLPKKKKEIVL